MNDHDNGMAEACEKVGGQRALAERLGVSQAAISKWVMRGYAPIGRIPAIAELTGIPSRSLMDPRAVDLAG